MNLNRTIETLYPNLVYSMYAEVQDNTQKINALSTVTNLVAMGNKVFRVERKEDSLLVGVEVGNGNEVLFSKFRKIII